MSDYYGVSRSEAYLEHYGIKGMKWGVRKALYYGDARALRRQYRKAAKKLAKLEKRGNGAKYAARAAALGAGAATLGTLGFNNNITGQIAKRIVPLASKLKTRGLLSANKAAIATKTGKAAIDVNDIARRRLLSNISDEIKKSKAGQRRGGGYHELSKSIDPQRQQMISRGLVASERRVGMQRLTGNDKIDAGAQVTQKYRVNRVGASGNIKDIKTANLNKGKEVINDIRKADTSKYVKLGLLTAGAGLAGAAGYNAYRAATTKKARKKALEFRKAMNETFKGTEYEKLGGLPLPKQRRRRRR